MNRNRYMLIGFSHQVLKSYGFNSHDEYYQSERWQTKREAFKRDCLRLRANREKYGRDVCEYCKLLRPFEVHHATYRNICAEN